MCPKGHGLPKHFCNKCGTGPSAFLNEPDDGWCAVHGKPEDLCQECAKAKAEGKTLPTLKVGTAKVCREPLATVRLASAMLADKIGIQTAEVTEETHAHRLVANAETAYDANHYADITPRVSGFIRELRVDLGRTVKQNDILCIIDSAEVSSAKTQYISAQAGSKLAQATAERTQALTGSGAVAGKAELEVMTVLNQAQASVMDSEQKLRNLGFGDVELTEILKTKDTRNLLSVVVPINRTVVLRHAVKGEAVQPAAQLFAIADTSNTWIWVDFYESDIQKVKPGQSVSFTIPGTRPEDSFARSVRSHGLGPRSTSRRGRPASGRKSQTQPGNLGSTSSARPRLKSALPTRPLSSRKTPCSGRTRLTSSSSPKGTGASARSG